MSRKKAVVKPNALDGRTIDLILPILAKLGISFTDRPQADILAGLVNGLLGEMSLWGEVWGGEDEIHVKIWSVETFEEEQKPEVSAKIEQINNLPECRDGEERWLRIVSTEPRRSGRKHVMLVARIKPATIEVFEEKSAIIVLIVGQRWPL